MVTNPEKMEAIAEWTHILVTNYNLTSLEPLLNVLETLAADWKKELVIIADNISWEAISTIILSKAKGSFKIIWIKAPWFWDEKNEILKDISILTWWEFINSEFTKLENVNPSHLWFAKKVISTKENTTIIWWEWEENEIQNRISQLKLELDSSNNEIQKEKISERIWKLSWWVAVIKVWAATEVEAKEKKFRIEDALSATKSALSEWIVAWWWTSLFRISELFDETEWKNSEEKIWIEIVKNALIYPIIQISENWWFDSKKILEDVKNFIPEKNFSEKFLEKFWKNKNPEFNFWFNALNWKIENLVQNWIIDPKMVVRSALENAASAASMFLTTEAVITNSPKWMFDFEMPKFPQKEIWNNLMKL